MATIRIKRGSSDPSAAQLTNAGELAVNTSNPGTKLFVKTASDTTTTPIWVGAQIEDSPSAWSSNNKLATQNAINTTFMPKAGGTFSGDITLGTTSEIIFSPRGGGAGSIILQAPSATTSNASYTFTLPVDDGNANEVLRTDGSGTLSWGAPGAASGVSVTDDNTLATRYLLFADGTGTGKTVYADTTTGPLTYNPSSGFLNIPGNMMVTGGTIESNSATSNLWVNRITNGDTFNIASGVISNGVSTTINIGTGGVNGSTVNCNLGSNKGGTAFIGSPTIQLSDSSTGTITTGSTTFKFIESTATTVTAFNSATNISIGHTATAAQTVDMFTSSTGTSTYNFATGTTGANDKKTINIGTGGDSSATTDITLGNGLSEKSNITLQGYVTITKGATITGNLTVNGTTTTVNSTVTSLDDPIITLGGDTSTAETTKDRGVEFKWAGATVTMTNYIGNGTTTVTGTTSSTSGWIAGDIITISGATGTGAQGNLNGTWTIASVPTGTTFTFVVNTAVAAGTYTTSIGTTVRSKNGFFGLDQSTGRFTFIPQASNSSEVFSGALGDIEVADVIVTGGDITSGAAVASNLFGTTTSGNITVGNGLTTGTLTLGSATGSGTIAIGNTGTAAAQTVNIATATTGTITIGGTGATAVQLPTGKTKVGQTTLVQGVSGNITFPSNTGTLALTSDALSSSTSSTQSGYFGDIFLYDDSSPSHYLQITNSANLTAARSLSVNVNDANRTVSLSGDLTLANNLTTSGNFALTLTTSAITNATIPSGTITLADLSTSQTFTNKSLTAPRITTGSHIADANGNELLVFPSAVASAVNEITVSNAATGSNPSITASGGDTNINLVLAGKGTGSVSVSTPFVSNCATRTSGSASYFRIIGPGDSGITASTESIGIDIVPAPRQWATGALTTQREVVFKAPSYGFVAASTITNAINVDIENPVSNVNATFTNAYALRAANTNITGTLLVNGTANATFSNTGNVSITPTGGLTINPSTTGTINNTSIGATTRSTGAFTTLDANSTVGLSPANANVTISPTGTGTVTIQPVGGLTINPTAVGNINNTNIGASTRGTGAFTTLNANQNTASTSTTTGTLIVTGGVGVSGAVFAGGAINATATTASTSTTTGSLIVGGGAGVAGALWVGGGIQTSSTVISTITGTTQGSNALTNDINVVTATLTSGTNDAVTLPTGTAGRRLIVVNRSATVALKVFPASSGQIDTLGTNAAYTVQPLEYAEFDATASGQWYASGTVDGGTY